MRKNLLGLDHVVILVHDIDAAAETYTRLGFTLTPRGAHSIGTRNHCLMLGSDYVELLAVATPHPVTTYFSRFLAESEGAAAVAIATDDAEAAQRSLVASGIDADAPVDFSRPVELAGGARDARFRVVQLPVDATPGCRTFLCQHFTPELVWRSEYQRHPVGAVGIAGIDFAVDDPLAAADAFGRLLEAAPEATAEGRRVALGAASLTFHPRAALDRQLGAAALSRRSAPAVQALRLRVADAAEAEVALRRGGFNPVRLADGASVVAADEAHGVAIVFEERG
ncbi:MAG: VOC family protein [Caldimonas sp.]